MRKTLSTRLAVLIGAGGLLAACGDNILPDTGDDPDAAPIIDASLIDAEVPDATVEATVAGTIAVTDVTLTDPSTAGVGGVRGGAISIGFADLTAPNTGGAPIFGTSPIGGCLITEFTAANPPSPAAAGTGPIVVSGTGLLKTVGPCTFQAAFNTYVCISHAANAGTETIAATNLPAPNPAGAILYTMPAQTFTAIPGMIGSYLRVGDFVDNNFDSPVTSAFPVVNQNATNGLVVVNPAGEASTTETITTGNFTVLNGFQPVPAAGAAADFLGPETGMLTITKAQDAVWPAIDFTTYTRGEGFDLDDVSSLPHVFPFAAPAALSFTCAGTGGTCGAEGVATLEATILSGRASKKSVAALFPFQMPTEIPGTDNWLEWQCAYLLSDTATMPQTAVQEIIDWGPTRIEMRVLRVAGTIVNDGGVNETRILIGHGLVGHADPP